MTTTDTAEIAGEYAVSGGEGDPSFVAERLEDLHEEQAAAEEQARQFEGVKERLEQKRDRQRRVVDVMGEAVEFRPVGGDTARRAMSLRQEALQGEDTEAEAELISLVFDTLAEHSIDDEMTADWWAGFPLPEVQEAFEDLVMSDMDADQRAEIEQFRGE